MSKTRPARAPWIPVTAADLPSRLARWLALTPGIARVAVDGADCAGSDCAGVAALADALIEPLSVLGRPAVHVRASSFWRDASLRLEYGREDVQSYLGWLDAAALRREVLDPAVAQAQYLPSLRDPTTNRSTRVAGQPLAPNAVLLVSGEFLLGLDLPFDRVVHLSLSPAALTRRLPADKAWTVPAHEQYATGVRPTELADVVVKVDDPRHPAVRGLAGPFVSDRARTFAR